MSSVEKTQKEECDIKHFLNTWISRRILKELETTAFGNQITELQAGDI